MTPTGPPRPTRRRRWLVLFLAALVFVIAVFIDLQAWKDSVFDPWADTHASPGTYQLIEAIEVAAIPFLFWMALRAGRETGWLLPVLFTAGAVLYLYRVVVLSGLFPANATYTTARTYFPDWAPSSDRSCSSARSTSSTRCPTCHEGVHSSGCSPASLEASRSPS